MKSFFLGIALVFGASINLLTAQNCFQSLTGLKNIMRASSSDKEDLILAQGYGFEGTRKMDSGSTVRVYQKCETSQIANAMLIFWDTGANSVSSKTYIPDVYLKIKEEIKKEVKTLPEQHGEFWIYFGNEFTYYISTGLDSDKVSYYYISLNFK